MQFESSPLRPTSKPKLALVIGSGGVRSAVALGVAQALNDAGIDIDLIAGCSSGALIGAVLAMGLPPQDALLRVQRFWSPELTERKRWRAYAELAMPRIFGFGESFSLRDARAIAAAVHEGFGAHRLDSMPIPMRVAATEASTGESVVLQSGLVSEAVMASMALPFMFPGVSIDGRRFVDGVLSNPLPVSAAADSRVVIAVGARGVMPRRVNRPGRMVGQITTAMINNLQAAQIRAARARDMRLLMLDAQVDARVGLWDPQALPRMFEFGVRRTQDRLPEIRDLIQDAHTSRAA